ncbi:hypothetical protein ZWY2020_006657 [Hordeum vulgare]|nr:hypothetical protein ZWY2020_006657 [Hordeum vulgare]
MLPPLLLRPKSTPAPTPMAPLPLPLLLALAGLAVAAAQPFTPPPQQQATDASDAAALRAVFQRWGLGFGATVNLDHPCGTRDWPASFARNASVGCSCDGSPECRITHLNVTGFSNLTGIPPELFNLTELVSLDLSNNNLSGSIPQEVANLSKLQTWRFNNNKLSGLLPNESSRLGSLQSLWMFDNYIEGQLPEFIANLTNLTDLRIYGTKLRGPIPKNFSNLTNLKILMLGDLDGGNSTFDFIADETNVSILSLRNCGIGQFPSNPPNLRNLTYLDLRSNNLSGSMQQLRLFSTSKYTYVGENNFSGNLPSEIVQSSRGLDVSYNPFLNGNLPNNPADRNWSINYIGTSIAASRTINSENLTLLNCLHMKECNRKFYTNPITSFAVNCGGKQKIYPDSLPITFNDDTSDLGAAGFHVNTDRQWIVSHVGSDPFSDSPGTVNTTQDILGTDMPDLYQTARTSRSALSYYAVGLLNGQYTVQLFFAEILIDSQLYNGTGRRLFNIDIQGQNIKTDFDITKEAGGVRRPTNITREVTVDNSVLKIHLYWSGRGTCCIPYEGAYGPLVSAIRVFRPEKPNNSPPPPRPVSAPSDDKRRGVVAGIAALCIAAAVISSSVVYLWWKWVALVKHPNA